MMSRLLVDVGNSYTKWWLDRGQTVIDHGRCPSSAASLSRCLSERGIAADVVALASVAAPEQTDAFVSAIREQTRARVLVCQPESHYMGLTISYAPPETMGVDRWLAMLAAWHGFRGAVAVIDAGTALTIDLVAANGQHQGGYILPGPTLMQISLAQGAQRISVTPCSAPVTTPGHATEHCVAAGAWLAVTGAVKDIISRWPRHRIVVCGGDADTLLGANISAEHCPDLVHQGLSLWLTNRGESG